MLRRWFVPHWFGGVLAVLCVAWAASAVVEHRRSERNRLRQVFALRGDLGLELDRSGPRARATIVRLLPAGMCGACGSLEVVGRVAQVDFRKGDWFYSAPNDAPGIGPAPGYELGLLAFNRTSGEKLSRPVWLDPSGPPRSVDEELLNSHGLAPTDAARMTPSRAADLKAVTVQRAGCVLLYELFAALALVWCAIGGVAWLRTRRVPAKSILLGFATLVMPWLSGALGCTVLFVTHLSAASQEQLTFALRVVPALSGVPFLIFWLKQLDRTLQSRSTRAKWLATACCVLSSGLAFAEIYAVTDLMHYDFRIIRNAAPTATPPAEWHPPRLPKLAWG